MNGKYFDKKLRTSLNQVTPMARTNTSLRERLSIRPEFASADALMEALGGMAEVSGKAVHEAISLAVGSIEDDSAQLYCEKSKHVTETERRQTLQKLDSKAVEEVQESEGALQGARKIEHVTSSTKVVVDQPEDSESDDDDGTESHAVGEKSLTFGRKASTGGGSDAGSDQSGFLDYDVAHMDDLTEEDYDLDGSKDRVRKILQGLQPDKRIRVLSQLNKWFGDKAHACEIDSLNLEGVENDRQKSEDQIFQGRKDVIGKLDDVDLQSFETMNKFNRILREAEESRQERIEQEMQPGSPRGRKSAKNAISKMRSVGKSLTKAMIWGNSHDSANDKLQDQISKLTDKMKDMEKSLKSEDDSESGLPADMPKPQELLQLIAAQQDEIALLTARVDARKAELKLLHETLRWIDSGAPLPVPDDAMLDIVTEVGSKLNTAEASFLASVNQTHAKDLDDPEEECRDLKRQISELEEGLNNTKSPAEREQALQDDLNELLHGEEGGTGGVRAFVQREIAKAMEVSVGVNKSLSTLEKISQASSATIDILEDQEKKLLPKLQELIDFAFGLEPTGVHHSAEKEEDAEVDEVEDTVDTQEGDNAVNADNGEPTSAEAEDISADLKQSQEEEASLKAEIEKIQSQMKKLSPKEEAGTESSQTLDKKQKKPKKEKKQKDATSSAQLAPQPQPQPQQQPQQPPPPEPQPEAKPETKPQPKHKHRRAIVSEMAFLPAQKGRRGSGSNPGSKSGSKRPSGAEEDPSMAYPTKSMVESVLPLELQNLEQAEQSLSQAFSEGDELKGRIAETRRQIEELLKSGGSGAGMADTSDEPGVESETWQSPAQSQQSGVKLRTQSDAESTQEPMSPGTAAGKGKENRKKGAAAEGAGDARTGAKSSKNLKDSAKSEPKDSAKSEPTRGQATAQTASADQPSAPSTTKAEKDSNKEESTENRSSIANAAAALAQLGEMNLENREKAEQNEKKGKGKDSAKLGKSDKNKEGAALERQGSVYERMQQGDKKINGREIDSEMVQAVQLAQKNKELAKLLQEIEGKIKGINASKKGETLDVSLLRTPVAGGDDPLSSTEVPEVPQEILDLRKELRKTQQFLGLMRKQWQETKPSGKASAAMGRKTMAAAPSAQQQQQQQQQQQPSTSKWGGVRGMLDIETDSAESSKPVRQTTFAGAVSAIAGRQTAFTLPESSARSTMFGKMPTEGSAGMSEKSQTFGKSLPLSTPSSRKTQHDSSHAHHAEKSHTVRQTTFGSHPPEGSKSEKLSEKNVRHTTFMPTHPTTASQLLEGIGEAAHMPANKPHAHFEPGHGHHGHQGHQGHDHEDRRRSHAPKGRESLMAAFTSPNVRFTMVKNRLTQHHAHHSPRSDHKDSEAGSGSNSMGLSVKPKKTQHDSHHDHHADTEAGTESGDKSIEYYKSGQNPVKHVEPPKPRGSMFHKAASLLMKSKS